jgi:hypothetical protein
MADQNKGFAFYETILAQKVGSVGQANDDIIDYHFGRRPRSISLFDPKTHLH